MTWWCTRIFPSAKWLADGHCFRQEPIQFRCLGTTQEVEPTAETHHTTAKCKVQLCNFGHKKSQTCRLLVLDGCISSSFFTHSIPLIGRFISKIWQVNHPLHGFQWPGRRLGPLPLDWVEELERPAALVGFKVTGPKNLTWEWNCKLSDIETPSWRNPHLAIWECG